MTLDRPPFQHLSSQESSLMTSSSDCIDSVNWEELPPGIPVIQESVYDGQACILHALHGYQAPQVPAEDRERAEAIAIAGNVHARLLDLETDRTIAFGKKFLEMLDRGSVYEQPVVQDPPVVRRRGRPHKAAKNTFNGGRIFT